MRGGGVSYVASDKQAGAGVLSFRGRRGTAQHNHNHPYVINVGTPQAKRINCRPTTTTTTTTTTTPTTTTTTEATYPEPDFEPHYSSTLFDIRSSAVV